MKIGKHQSTAAAQINALRRLQPKPMFLDNWPLLTVAGPLHRLFFKVLRRARRLRFAAWLAALIVSAQSQVSIQNRKINYIKVWVFAKISNIRSSGAEMGSGVRFATMFRPQHALPLLV